MLPRAVHAAGSFCHHCSVMATPLLQIDAFTAEPFAGNPAAVCMLHSQPETAWMQRVAREMNLSETAFLRQQDDGFELRWFTPAVEVDLCGHATLASAHALWELGRLDPGETARFRTRSGLLTAERCDGWIDLDFPATPPAQAPPPPGLLEALRVSPTYVGRSRFDYLIEVATEDIVRGLKPDFAALRAVDSRGVIVTSRSSSPARDFVSRFFAPAAGIDEDPVTGSAHCCLAPFWSTRLGKDTLVAHQVSERGGVLRVRVDGTRVHLSGQAITVLRGELLA
jgi:predicted PhzF superfamily epimerase YddE/YHI9